MSYSRVEYINVDCTFLDTGLNLKPNSKIVIHFVPKSIIETGDNIVVGTYPTYNESYTFAFNIHGGGYFRYYIGGYYDDNFTTYDFNKKYVVTLEGSGCTVENLTDSTTTTTGFTSTLTSDLTRNLYINFDIFNNSSNNVFDLFECYFYEGDDLVRHYLPYKDNETGYGLLYDAANNEFVDFADPSKVTPYGESFSIFPSSFNVSYLTTSNEIVVSSQDPWTASTQNEWLTLNTTTTETGGVVTVTTGVNTGGPRVGIISFTNGEDVLTCTIRQGMNNTFPFKNIYRNGRRIN